MQMQINDINANNLQVNTRKTNLTEVRILEQHIHRIILSFYKPHNIWKDLNFISLYCTHVREFVKSRRKAYGFPAHSAALSNPQADFTWPLKLAICVKLKTNQ